MQALSDYYLMYIFFANYWDKEKVLKFGNESRYDFEWAKFL